MGLVDYPSSPDSSGADEDLTSAHSHKEDQGQADDDARPSKKRKVSPLVTTAKSPPPTSSLPALPASFRDLYSSTVRTTTQDDPALHAGRQRATPHVVGNWPTHISLEWYPSPTDLQLLLDLETTALQQTTSPTHQSPPSLHSLLLSPTGVPLPLHISLSRPLTLSTPQKAPFTTALTASLAHFDLPAFHVQPSQLLWHPNEDRTRWFLVLRITSRPELRSLLAVCNDVARRFRQLELYATRGGREGDAAAASGRKVKDETGGGHFHVSIAWALEPPPPPSPSSVSPSTSATAVLQTEGEDDAAGRVLSIPEQLQTALAKLDIAFDLVKLRIGQDVTSFPLRKARTQAHVREKSEGEN